MVQHQTLAAKFNKRFAFTILCGISIALSSAVSYAVPVHVGNAPESSLALSLSAIRSARDSLLINIYELSNVEVAEALEAKILEGVHVEVLQEGQPVGGITAAGRGLQTQLVRAMQRMRNSDRYVEMTAQTRADRRFRYDHAKYIVVDGKSLLISSENYSPNGHPVAGSTGNRGWEVMIDDSRLASSFAAIFRSDSNENEEDILSLLPSRSALCASVSLFCALTDDTSGPSGFAVADSAPSRRWLSAPSVEELPELPVYDAPVIEKITSPETSLRGLVRMIDSARYRLDIQQMTLALEWKNAGGRSPLIDALFAAAKRGVIVRILINDDAAFLPPGSSNRNTKSRQNAALLNRLAREQGLPLTTRVADLAAMGVTIIHNKGALVDDNATLVSSINWNENSVMNNREAAVLIKGREVNAHYSALFERDWSASDPRRVEQESAELLTPCPETLSVKTEIGDLDLTGVIDPSFAKLENSVIEGTFFRHSQTDRECIFREGDQTELDDAQQPERSYLQIRKTAKGSMSIELAGYTSKHKLYSIRSIQRKKVEKLTGLFTASFYDSSGQTPKRLGKAVINLLEN
ncbi:MAG: phospholipase D-like domain-containing protein [Oligoflexia bacterium]|nr:phospholipase D-like domain-containing protein [Oligoflexia bacterium]